MTYITKTTPVIGSRLWTVGHSYLTGGGVTHADRQYITLLSGMWRTDLIDEGLGGSQVANDSSWLPLETAGGVAGQGGWAYVLQNIVPSRNFAPYTPSTWFPLVHTGLNDIQQHSHDGTGAPRTIFKCGLRTVLSRMVSSRTFDDTDASIAYGGLTWQPALACTTRNHGTQLRPIPGNNATVTITLPSDLEAGYVALGFTVFPTSDGSITLSGTASGATGTTSLAGLAYAAGGTSNRRNSSNGAVIRVPVLASDATKTIIATYSSGAGTTFSTPGTSVVSNIGTAGATTYTYQRVYRTYNGDTIPSTSFSTTTGNATLSGTTYNSIAAGSAWPSGVEAELIIRTVGGSSQGLIKTLTAGPAIVLDQAPASGAAYTAVSTSALTGGAAFDYWQIEAANPVTRGIVVGINRVLSYSNSATDADVTNYNADIQSVIAEFPSGQWLFVDVDSALNKTTSLFSSDSIHPNDRGHATLAATINSAVTNWQQTWSMTDIAHQSRTMKRVTSRNIITRLPGGTGNADYTIATGTWAAPDAGLTLYLDAQVGDDLEVSYQGMWGVQAGAGQLDFAILNSSSTLLRYVSSLTTTPSPVGLPSGYVPSTIASLFPINCTAVYQVQDGDPQTVFTVPGIVIVQLRASAATNARTLYGGGSFQSPSLTMQIKNLGNRNNGFNGS